MSCQVVVFCFEFLGGVDEVGGLGCDQVEELSWGFGLLGDGDFLMTSNALWTAAKYQIPLLVVSFPVLHQLDGSHPFSDLYRTVQERVEAAGGAFLDLFPVFSGHDAESLWVHPTDQHPNEVAHRMAAEAIAERLAAQIQGGAASKR